MSKLKDTVAWIMLDESVLKLSKTDKVFDLDCKVLEFIKKQELSEDGGFEVEVEVDESKGENGTIVRLTTGEAKKESKKTESKKEVEKEGVADADTVVFSETKELTVAGVSVKNKGVTFKEEDGVWYTLDDSINAEEFKNGFTKKTVKVAIQETEKGNDVIKAVELVEAQKGKVTNKSTSTDSYEVNTQKSIEAQVAVEHAQILVAKLVECKVVADVDEVNELIEKRAKRNYGLMQELKKSV